MLKVLLPVDGSEAAIRATQKLIETIGWYKERPTIDLLAVHLPVPRFPNMSVVVTEEMLARYYREECERMLAPCKKVLDAAGAKYTTHTRVGPIAEGIVDQAKQSASNMIYMDARDDGRLEHGVGLGDDEGSASGGHSCGAHSLRRRLRLRLRRATNAAHVQIAARY